MRIDTYIASNKLAPSREKAAFLVKNGNVAVNGDRVLKPSFNVHEGDEVSVFNTLRYVGRGGMKLEKALRVFHISVEGKTVLDVGASTGGFTDCALQHGAKKVYAVDVGHGQLDQSLVSDSRVCNYEGINITELNRAAVSPCDIITVDVSFVSLTKILPCLVLYAANGADIICLVKPQFELGMSKFKNGVVRDEKKHIDVIRKTASAAVDAGYAIKGLDYSPLRGGDGNIEFLLYLVNGGETVEIDVEKTVSQAHAVLKRKSK